LWFQAAPPVSRYFAEDPEQTNPPGGGYFAQVLQEICAEATKTGFLEPTQ